MGDKVHDQDLLLTYLKLDIVQAASHYPGIFLLSYDVLHDYKKFTSPHIRTYVHVRMVHGEAAAIKVAILYCCTTIEHYNEQR